MVARTIAHVPGATGELLKDRHAESIDHAPPRVDEPLIATQVLLAGRFISMSPLAADGLPGLLSPVRNGLRHETTLMRQRRWRRGDVAS